jgi:transposase-like protein
MAKSSEKIDVIFHEDKFEIISQVFCCEIHDTWENRKVWFVILRTLCSPKTGKPFFSYQSIADAFAYKARQNINNYVREYEQCDENMFDYLRHKRKVDPVVVDAVLKELGKDVLSKTGALCLRVNHRLEREDLTPANIRVALEHIPCTEIRVTVLREMAKGRLHPKEDAVLAELFAAYEQGYTSVHKTVVGSRCSSAAALSVDRSVLLKGDTAAETDAEHADVEELMSAGSLEASADSGKLLRYAEVVFAAGVKSLRKEPDDAVIQKIQRDFAEKLLTPHLAVSEIPVSVRQMVKAMTMYFSGASFSRLGCWFGGKAKSTMYSWVIGLALALWPTIQGWLWSNVKGARQYIDEKWLKIRKHWHYLFVSVDHDSGLPFFHELLPTRTKWACRLFLLKLKHLGKIPAVIITDGLQGYVSAIATVFPAAKHLLCLFHHQQSVTRCVNTHFCQSEQEEATAAKQKMKHVVQTHDSRTMNRRLERLEQTAKDKGWKILEWVKRTREKLQHLVPAIRPNTYPSTTNEIERFFRAFTRFYKTRCGFHSPISAKRAIIFFMVVYLFTIQAESNKAPIEKILPEANTMPLYRLLNYPFAAEVKTHSPPNVKPLQKMATESVREVA